MLTEPILIRDEVWISERENRQQWHIVIHVDDGRPGDKSLHSWDSEAYFSDCVRHWRISSSKEPSVAMLQL
jgi:hypothetical protein